MGMAMVMAKAICVRTHNVMARGNKSRNLPLQSSHDAQIR